VRALLPANALTFSVQVVDKVQSLRDAGEDVKKFSLTGYSLGGLIARYVIGCATSTRIGTFGLPEHSILYERDFFKDVEPVNFNTFATLHIGLLEYKSVFSRLFARLGPNLLSRTGAQFYLKDKWSPRGRPLIEVMADPRMWRAGSASDVLT
jgi:hypothetical protein